MTTHTAPNIGRKALAIPHVHAQSTMHCRQAEIITTLAAICTVDTSTPRHTPRCLRRLSGRSGRNSQHTLVRDAKVVHCIVVQSIGALQGKLTVSAMLYMLIVHMQLQCSTILSCMPVSCVALCFRHVIGEPLVQLGSSSFTYRFINRLDLAAAVIALLMVLEMLAGIFFQATGEPVAALHADLLYCFLHDETGCSPGLSTASLRCSKLHV
jgi:hypothetical protein